MQRRIALSHHLFYFGLALMLGNEILSATVLAGTGSALPVLTLAGAVIALAARLWHHRLRRAARPDHTIVDLGGYPLDLLRHPRFTHQRRTTT